MESFSLLGAGAPAFQYIDRVRFGADIAVTFPELLKSKGSALYMSEIVPKIVAYIAPSSAILNVESKGIYVNILFSDQYLLSLLRLPLEQRERYGRAPTHEGHQVVVDYSSPNVAKHLHAGHIRSTIIGHVLGNLYQAVGYSVHRVNHVNDWGGFGYLLTAYEDHVHEMPQFEKKNDFLFYLYTTFRRLEEAGGDTWDAFKKRSDDAFRKLEAGAAHETAIWKEMVRWSLEDFQLFYDAFQIRFDEVRGESAYSKDGAELVRQWVGEGKAIEKDGAVFVPISNDPTDPGFVVRRSDESTIYATRDLAAIKYRVETYNPDRILYVVGQEQSDYFRRLFATAKNIGVLPETVEAIHIPFGFYVNASDKKKLSSRKGAQSVDELLRVARAYFETRLLDRGAPPEEAKISADILARSSIIFNDIQKDRMKPVEIEEDAEATVRQFELSGGAYVMYAAARSRSIIKKYGKELPALTSIILDAPLAPHELDLIKLVLEMPSIISKSVERNEPARVAEYLQKLAQAYNSYYEHYPVLEGGVLAYPHRLVLTEAVYQTLRSGLLLCHISLPERL